MVLQCGLGGFDEMAKCYDVAAITANEGVPSANPNSLVGLAPVLRERNIAPLTPIERHHRDDNPSQILPFLFVGAEAHAENIDLLKKFGITHILNLTTRMPKRHHGIQYLIIPLRVSVTVCPLILSCWFAFVPLFVPLSPGDNAICR